MLLTFKETRIMKKQTTICHPSQLNSLSTLPLLHRTGLGRIVLDDSFQHANKAQWEREINKRYYACGCDQGAKSLILGLLLFGIGGWFGYIKYEWLLSHVLILFFGGSIVMAIIGKLIGLIHANMELRRVLREVQSVWKPYLEESKIIGCG